MNIILRLIKGYQEWHNLHIFKGKYILYTKSSYSHQAPKTKLFRSNSFDEAITKQKEFESKYPQVLFYVYPTPHLSAQKEDRSA